MNETKKNSCLIRNVRKYTLYIVVNKVGVDKVYKFTAEKKHKVSFYIIVALVFVHYVGVFAVI